MSDEAARTPRALILPEDTSPIWQRLTDLQFLRWPTSAQRLEATILIAWLNPYHQLVLNRRLIGVAASGIARLSDGVSRAAIGRDVWRNLLELEAGRVLPKPQLTPTDLFLDRQTGEFADDTSSDQRRYGRRHQPASGPCDWFESAMMLFEELLAVAMQREPRPNIPAINACLQLLTSLVEQFSAAPPASPGRSLG